MPKLEKSTVYPGSEKQRKWIIPYSLEDMTLSPSEYYDFFDSLLASHTFKHGKYRSMPKEASEAREQKLIIRPSVIQILD